MFKISQSSTLSLNLPQKPLSSPTPQFKTLKNKFIVTQNASSFLQQKRKVRSFIKIQRMISPSSTNGRWTREEHNRFIDAIIIYGNDWKRVQKHVYSRSSTQARSHAQKFLLKLKHSEIFKKKKIDTNMSWAKTIQYLKNEFSNEELYEILKSVTKQRKTNSKKNIIIDDANTAFSISAEEETQLKKEEEDVNFLYDGGKKEESIINDNEYIKTFIDSFNFKSDLDFDLNELNMVYFNNNKNISEY